MNRLTCGATSAASASVIVTGRTTDHDKTVPAGPGGGTAMEGQLQVPFEALQRDQDCWFKKGDELASAEPRRLTCRTKIV